MDETIRVQLILSTLGRSKSLTICLSLVNCLSTSRIIVSDVPSATSSLKEVITNKCGMHMGVNLRKAQNAGIHEYERESITPVDNELDSTEDNEQLTTNQRREYIPTDNFVHAFCKLLGQHGTPEYGQGNSFRDYIIHELAKSKLNRNNDRTQYLDNVLKTNLQRQVGRRYFVTAYNSCRIYFIRKAALEFLEHLSKTKSLNKLEQYVQSNPVMLGNVKIDGLLFYHVYSV